MFGLGKKKPRGGPGDNITRDGESTFAIFDENDPALVAAKAEAARTQAAFWRRFDGRAEEFAVKVGLSTPNGAVEHIWMAVDRRSDDKIVGRLINEPVNLPDLRYGDEVIVDADRLSDWSYMAAGKMFGGFTVRASLNRASDRERHELEAILSADPLESEAS